jgi:hypothetical protein
VCTPAGVVRLLIGLAVRSGEGGGCCPPLTSDRGICVPAADTVYNECLCHQTGYCHAYQWAYSTWDGGHTIAFENEVTEGHTGICVVLYLSGIRTRTRHSLYGTHVLFALRLGVEQIEIFARGCGRTADW